MKKILLLFFAAALVFSCQKKEQNIVPPPDTDVVFNITEVNPNDELRSPIDWTCPTDDQGNLLVPAYAYLEIIINGVSTPFTPEVYSLDGQLYTQAIKLPAPKTGTTSYTVTKFVLKTSDDVMIMATPAAGSDYSEYVSKTVLFTFDVSAFAKAQVPVEVLCFSPEDYTNFGFDWFQINQTVVREQCFFGDICVKHPDEYLTSLYGTAQPPIGECKIDMSALFKVFAYIGDTTVPANQLPNSPFTNATPQANYGVGSPLCVQYPDNLEIQGEVFTFNLYILVKSGSDFVYKYFATFTSTDDGPLMDVDGNPVPDVDGDKITEFVLGSCNYSDTDVQFPPYQNLPETCTLVIGTTWAPAPVSGEYMDATISGINNSDYDLNDGTYGSYCFDRLTDIYVGQSYDMDIYSSLYPALLPAYLQNEEWDRVNWLINHLGDYAWGWSDLQQVIWKLEDPSWGGTPYGGCSAITSVGNQMYSDAVAYGDGFVPLPGGWAVVCFVPTGTPPDQQDPLVQTVFVKVDP